MKKRQFSVDKITKQIVAWGADKTFEFSMKKHPLKVEYLVDNNSKKQGSTFLNIPVKSPLVLKNISGKTIIVFVFFFPEIKEQLERMGLVYKKDFFHFFDFAEYQDLIDTIITDKDYHFLEKIIKPGWVCVDVGANCGFFTYKLSMLAGKKGKIYSVEPLKFAYAQLLRFKELYSLKNVTTFNMALVDSDKIKSVKMATPKINNVPYSGMSHIVGVQQGFKEFKKMFALKYTKETPNTIVKARAATLDSLSFAKSKVDFIKIDTEGAELLVLKGAKKLLSSYHPLIQCELLWGDRRKVISYLKGFGYDCYYADKTLKKYNPKIKGEYNYYFIRT